MGQWNLAHAISAAMEASYHAYHEYSALQTAIALQQAALKDQPQAKDLLDALTKLQKPPRCSGRQREAPGIGPMNRDISRYYVMIESADMRPAASAKSRTRIPRDIAIHRTDPGASRLPSAASPAAFCNLVNASSKSSPAAGPSAPPVAAQSQSAARNIHGKHGSWPPSPH